MPWGKPLKRADETLLQAVAMFALEPELRRDFLKELQAWRGAWAPCRGRQLRLRRAHRSTPNYGSQPANQPHWQLALSSGQV